MAQVVETVEVLTELSGILARAAGKPSWWCRWQHRWPWRWTWRRTRPWRWPWPWWWLCRWKYDSINAMTVTMRKLSWSGDRGEVWADTLENFADALGDAGEVFSWLPFSKIKDTAGRQTELSITFCYKWIYHQVAEYAEIAAELAAAALPWQNPHEFCSKKGKDCFLCHIRIRFCWSVPVSF